MTTKGDTLRVFVSATSLDLAEHRAAVLAAIRQVDWHPVAMEDFGARPRRPLDVCLEDVRTCHALVVIVAHRYGWVPSVEDGGDGEKSVTWLEVAAALECDIPVFAFLVDPDRPWSGEREEADPHDAIDDEQGLAVLARVRGLKAFKKFLGHEAGIVRETFTAPDGLATKVSGSIARWREEQLRKGPAAVPHAPDLDAEITHYLRSAESAYENIALAGFETRVRVPIQLEDLYVPLDAMLPHSAFDDGGFGSAEEAEAKLRGLGKGDGQIPLTEAFTRADQLGGRRGLVILGDPGSGKTTHLKRLLLWLVRAGSEGLGLPAGMVPVFLPLRNLRDLDSGLDAFLEAELASPHLQLEKGFGRRLLERGNLLFLLDGLDEVADPKDRERVSRWIEGAMREHRDSRFVVTCRYAGYAGEAKLDGRLLELHLRPLTAEQASTFVRNWYRIVETSLTTDKERARIVAEEQAAECAELSTRAVEQARRQFRIRRHAMSLSILDVSGCGLGDSARNSTRADEPFESLGPDCRTRCFHLQTAASGDALANERSARPTAWARRARPEWERRW